MTQKAIKMELLLRDRGGEAGGGGRQDFTGKKGSEGGRRWEGEVSEQLEIGSDKNLNFGFNAAPLCADFVRASRVVFRRRAARRRLLQMRCE